MIWAKEETLPREEIERIQLTKLKDTVRYIYDRVKPYREKMDMAGVRPEDIQTLEDLKKRSFWVVGCDLDQSQDYRQIDYNMPLVIVIGSEGFGISRLVKKSCDFNVVLPMVGHVTSLNASVATAVILYQVYNSRNPL